MIRIIRALCFSVAWLSLAGPFAAAQTYTPFQTEFDKIIEDTRYQIGPFRLFPRIGFPDFGYDNNIFRREEERVSDFMITVAPGLTTNVLIGESVILNFLVDPEYIFYFDHPNLRGWNSSYSSGFRWRLLYRFVLSGNFSDTSRRQRPTDEFRERVNINSKSYEGSVFYEIPQLITFGFSGIQNEITHESLAETDSGGGFFRRLDRDESNINFELYYPVREDTDLFMRTGYFEYDFKSPESSFKNSYAYQIASGIGFPIIGNIRGSMSLGYKWFYPREHVFSKFSGVIGNTGIDYRISRFGIRIIFSRDIPFSFSESNIYFTQNRIGGGISYYPASFLRLDYDAALGRSTYPESVASVPAGQEEYQRKDEYLIHRAAIIIRIFGTMGFGFSLDYQKRSSNLSGFGYDSTYFGVFLTQDF
jgi:hypothetical protein